jgi:hypothetical protein
LLAFATLLVSTSSGAGAPVYAVSFGGTVNHVPPQLDDGTFEVGEEVSGFFRIDASVPDSEQSATEGRYGGAVSERTLEIGDYEASASTGLLFIRDSTGAPFVDEFYVDGVVSGAAVAGLAPGNFIFSLTDSSLAAISDDAIPTALDLDDFDPSVARLFFPEGNTSYALELNITSLSYSPVPEPGGAWMALSGWLTLGAMRRRPGGSRAPAAA